MAYLRTLTDNPTVVNVDTQMLTPGSSYTFTLELTNFFGLKSADTHTVTSGATNKSCQQL